MTPKSTLLSWSGGKDSAYALYLLLKDSNIKIQGLFTTINKEAQRSAMHGIRLELLEKQSKQIGLPIDMINLSYPCTNHEYENVMKKFITQAHAHNIKQIAFGDIYLEDIRDYRIKQMQNTGIKPIFPCWGMETKSLAKTIINLGIKAKITCIDPNQLSEDYTGLEFSHHLINHLPKGVDSCGENGEFHTFVYDAPYFSQTIQIKKGKTIKRDSFVFTDWL